MHTSVTGPDNLDYWEGLGQISYQSKPSLQRYVLRKRGAALFSKLLKNFNIFPFCRNGSPIYSNFDSIVDGLDPLTPGVILEEKVSNLVQKRGEKALFPVHRRIF